MVAPLSDQAPETAADAAVSDETLALPGDGLREGIIDDLRSRIGDALVDTHITPNDDLWVRVRTDAWRQTGEALKAAGFTFFSFLSAIDWLPSPYGKGEDDPTAEPVEPDTEIRQGVTGGETRLQVFARVVDLDRHVGVTIKADVPDDVAVVDSWSTVYAGANWHERECHEMFGIGFNGHPGPAQPVPPHRIRGLPAAQGLPPARPHGEAVARHRRRRTDARRRRSEPPRKAGPKPTASPPRRTAKPRDQSHRSAAAQLHRQPGG